MLFLFGGEWICMVVHLSDLLRQIRTYHCQVKFLDMEAGEDRDIQESECKNAWSWCLNMRVIFLLPTWFTNFMFIHTNYIKLNSSTCFECNPLIIRRSTMQIVHMQALVSSLSASDRLVQPLRKDLILCNLCEWTRNLCIKLAIIKKLYYDVRPTKYQDQIQIFRNLDCPRNVSWFTSRHCVCMYLAAINDELSWGRSVQGCQLGQSSWKRWTDAFRSTFPALGLRPASWTSDFMRQMCPTNQQSIQLRGVTCWAGPSGRPAVRLVIPEYWMHRWSWATICSHLLLYSW